MNTYRPVYTPTTKESVRLLDEQGVSATHIAKALRISQETVFTILEDLVNEGRDPDHHLQINRSEPEVDKLLSLDNVVIKYVPEYGILKVKAEISGATPASVEWMASLLACFLNEQIESF